ncbi:hypothetical protein [Cohnella ginsengisoli]|uniref:hypothetical protein n=1 Tax=Cohnella ginsengisoli TaxID=425004 RepID=UPI003B8A7F2D
MRTVWPCRTTTGGTGGFLTKASSEAEAAAGRSDRLDPSQPETARASSADRQTTAADCNFRDIGWTSSR